MKKMGKLTRQNVSVIWGNYLENSELPLLLRHSLLLFL